ncbi:cytochrome c oxidase subunit IV [Tamaricihabitans halophyticus]|uniref:Cytochrome c oxidase polypeptide 4 n=1 Tax=Tamaricihabitans halophyticus TaxID=1262583 RepID=A0A4R2QY42_9PSEU|nr:cytochrome c oxidase subunit 4 [Tamaricihabitans halophyticus]TCP55093.1 cytochrome c oxidase subunit IV [Tamaricihabitans halophyticus]
MKVEARIFDIVTAFAFVVAIIYGVLTHFYAHDGVEPVGLTALILTGGLSMLVGTYFRFIARRIEHRPEDRGDAEIADGAGELGFFSPGSYWPIALAGSAAVTGVAMAFGQWWMVVLGGIALLISVGGLVFEYHSSPNET